MSRVSDLTTGYGKFFKECLEASVSPYTKTCTLFVNYSDEQEQIIKNLALGVGLCFVLSTVFPVLPEACTISLALNFIAACLGAVSMLFAYPIAGLMDFLDREEDSAQRLECV
ncbi:MAG: hypothetical protein ACOYKA_04225 [Legionellaceae bacterium]